MMKESELEEGEAHVDQNDASIDPDTALSYIDKKLQHLLGHFQKDFEHEMSAEALGPKYGGYGSFLPTRKHPLPILSHTTPLNPNKPSSPNNAYLEDAPVKDVVVDQNVVSADDVASKDTSKNEATTSKSVNPTGKRSLKVRIKVGSYTPAIKKDEIYSGLGLLTPSSTSNNSEDSNDSQIESRDMFDSPDSILSDMCSIFVPGNRLLSPLNDSLVCLKNKVMPLITGKIVDDSSLSLDKNADKKDSLMKIKKTKKELINEQFFGPDSTSIESNESYEQKNVKRLSLDSRRVKLVVCKNDSSVIKHETGHFEKKAGLKAISCEPHEVKVSNNMTKLPFERTSKLTGIDRKENLRDKKRGLKDIVKVRSSYKDILGTDNGAIKVENADMAVPQQTVVGPLVPPDNWVGCDRCEKWRLLPIGIEPANLPDKWLCSMTTWLPGRNHCDIGEDETTRAVQEMNLRFISQNQGSLQCNGSMGTIGISDHKHSNVYFEKNKSRPLEGTSLSSIDGQQDYKQKRKSETETNQLLLEKKDDVKLKKLKSMTGSEQYEPGTSKKIKIESEQLNFSNRGSRPKDGLVISVKTDNDSTLSDKKMEIHAKKRKLKDWQESQPHGNTSENSENRNRIIRKEKRLKTEVNESSDDRCLYKGKAMKIRLLASKEKSVDRCKLTCKKDLESQRLLVAATSSSSIVSGSCKRACLQERKRSPVGPPLSSPNVDKISRKAHVKTEIPSQSQRTDGKVKEASKIRKSHNLEHTTDSNAAIDKCERSKLRRVEVNLVDTGVSEMTPTVKKKIKKVSNELEPKVEAQTFDRSDQNRSKVIKHPANQTAKSLVTDSGTLKNLSVTSFLKEFASSQSQTALTAFKRAEESRDFADRLKVSGFDYQCNYAYFDSALKFLCAASLLESCNADISKSKGVDSINVYTTSAKLSKICGQEYEKEKDMVASALAYKCMEVACMRIVYCKNLLTRQDLQTSESPSSSASDVDNLNNQQITDKAILSKSMVIRNQANFSRLLDLTSDVNLAMEASTKAQNAYKSASAVLEEAKNKEMTFAVKRVVNFSFQDVKEFACLVQKAREAVDRQGNRRQ